MPTENAEVLGGGERKRLDGVAGFLLSVVVHLVALLWMALMVWTSDSESPQLLVQLGATETTGTIATISSSSPQIEAPAKSESYRIELVDVAEMMVVAELSEPSFEEVQREASVEKAEVLTGKNVLENEPSEEPNEADRKIEFFGTHAYGNEFVFVVDISGSMGAGGGTRMIRARTELIEAVEQLNESQSFAVVLYNERALVFGANSRNNVRLNRGTPENKRRLKHWMHRAQPKGGTFPGEALWIAGKLVPDAVFFLSDGEFAYDKLPGMPTALDRFLDGFGNARPKKRPSDERMTPKRALDAYEKQIVVHTIALESEGSWPLMQRIATEKGGEFRFIPAPKRSTVRRQR